MRLALGLAVGFHLALVLLPLLMSRDVYSYIAHGQIVSIHGGNPYVQTPADFPSSHPRVGRTEVGRHALGVRAVVLPPRGVGHSGVLAAGRPGRCIPTDRDHGEPGDHVRDRGDRGSCPSGAGGVRRGRVRLQSGGAVRLGGERPQRPSCGARRGGGGVVRDPRPNAVGRRAPHGRGVIKASAFLPLLLLVVWVIARSPQASACAPGSCTPGWRRCWSCSPPRRSSSSTTRRSGCASFVARGLAGAVAVLPARARRDQRRHARKGRADRFALALLLAVDRALPVGGSRGLVVDVRCLSCSVGGDGRCWPSRCWGPCSCRGTSRGRSR